MGNALMHPQYYDFSGSEGFLRSIQNRGINPSRPGFIARAKAFINIVLYVVLMRLDAHFSRTGYAMDKDDMAEELLARRADDSLRGKIKTMAAQAATGAASCFLAGIFGGYQTRLPELAVSYDLKVELYTKEMVPGFDKNTIFNMHVNPFTKHSAIVNSSPISIAVGRILFIIHKIVGYAINFVQVYIVVPLFRKDIVSTSESDNTSFFAASSMGFVLTSPLKQIGLATGLSADITSLAMLFAAIAIIALAVFIIYLYYYHRSIPMQGQGNRRLLIISALIASILVLAGCADEKQTGTLVPTVSLQQGTRATPTPSRIPTAAPAPVKTTVPVSPTPIRSPTAIPQPFTQDALIRAAKDMLFGGPNAVGISDILVRQADIGSYGQNYDIIIPQVASNKALRDALFAEMIARAGSANAQAAARKLQSYDILLAGANSDPEFVLFVINTRMPPDIFKTKHPTVIIFVPQIMQATKDPRTGLSLGIEGLQLRQDVVVLVIGSRNNLETFLHESGHFFVQYAKSPVYRAIFDDPDATIADYKNTVPAENLGALAPRDGHDEDWLLFKNDATLKERLADEWFAGAFQTWLANTERVGSSTPEQLKTLRKLYVQLAKDFFYTEKNGKSYLYVYVWDRFRMVPIDEKKEQINFATIQKAIQKVKDSPQQYTVPQSALPNPTARVAVASSPEPWRKNCLLYTSPSPRD